jgi:predicted Zn-dependent peptidase
MRRASVMSGEHHRLTTLDSGLRVVTERMENVRSVALGFWIPTGSAMEADDQAGISHLLEHMLFRGTCSHRSEEIDQIFDAMGAECNAETDREATSLYTRVLDHHLPRALEVMSEMVWSPRFEALGAEREVVLEEIAMYEDDPQDRVFDVLGEAVFGDHPLGRPVIGHAEVVRAVGEERLREFHRTRYLPERMVLAAAGSVDHDELVRMVEQAQTRTAEQSSSAGARDGGQAGNRGDGSGRRQTGRALGGRGDPLRAPHRGDDRSSGDLMRAPHSAPPLGPGALARRVRFLSKDTEQYHVCLGGAGIDRHDERRFALRVLEGVLGGTSSSRLFQEVREKRGLAYSVFCFSNLHAHAGEVGLYVGTRPENLSEAMATIAQELERFVERPCDAQELERSRENVKGRVGLALESTSARMSRLGSSVLGGLPILSVDEIVDRIDAVQAADVGELAGELFSPSGLSAAGVGPDEDAFQAALAPLQGVTA